MISSIIAILLVASVYANTVPDYKSFTIGICRQDSLTLGVTTLLRTLDEWNQVHSDYATNCWFCPRGADCTGVVANGRRCSDSELLVTADNQLSCFSRATATGYNAPNVPNTVTVTTNPPIQTVPTMTVPTGTVPTVTVPTGTVPTVTIPTVTVPNTVTVTANGVPIRTNIGAGVPLGNGFVNYPFTNQPMVPAGCSCGSLTGATYGQALGVAGGLLYNGAIVNGPLDARLINTPYGAGVVNGVYDARLLNGGLDTRFINAPYDARLLNGALDARVLNGPLDARLINTPYGAGVVNGVYDARLLNGGLDARVVNGPLDTQLFTPASYGYGLMNCAPYVPGTVARAIDTRFTTPYDTRFVNTPLNGALDARLINTPYTTQYVNTPLNGAGVVNGVYDARLLNGGLDARLINTPYDGAQVIGSVRTTPYFGAAAWAPNMAGAWSGATVRTTPGLVNNIGDAYGNNVNVVRDTPRSTY